ncbi:TPA: flagellar hook-associated protein FlgK [Vibrio alginolyticus]|uniref:flagellar hook-associated protein FlgK n=1 Tax=Vibrio alginolyticus TaxID=663 RepID=UPI0015943B37|nr:flagellar hook-associated protein FlgK [Vibrio alginolyticus]ELA8362807.1 flagellar hook-associated protein FlgK [Vibrio alginolyticus]MBS9962321.1 flagellar hook-associated protein FlgK [Vibrio alginolyticus]MBT0036733.1 flagellar hook-associated protein FlgK [Vibrio alginolyticus]MCQ9102314.1 flagellar hook-associated protein FlgK [Vibrio alginolyticus]MCR9540191.1 flagellar hook-associated protein FlgK [Vibrio alginolyticus]
MASDLLNVGTQSVLTAQRQLNTTGHNISNVNTEGYSRQSVIQGTNDPRMFGGSTYGMGVHVENVRRSWDQFAVNELNLSSTNNANKTDTQDNLDMLSSMLSSVASKKIPENLNEWFDAVKTMADTPNDLGARKVVLEKAKIFSDTLNDFHETVRLQSDVTNKKLDMGIERVNQLALEIRDIHRLMMRTPGPHNDLMDQHEKLVTELSEYTKVTVTPRKNAEGFNVHIGNGHTLVSGTEASQLKMIDGYPDVHQRRLAMVEGDGIKAIKSDDMDGKIGALLEMRDKHIPQLQDEMGRLATGFSYKINQLQSQGLDLNGKIGKDVFTDVNSELVAKSRVFAAPDSQADVAVYIEDISAIKGGEYSLRYDGDQYSVTTPKGEQMSLNIDRSDSSFVLDGMKVQIGEGLAAGERVLLRPTRSGAAIIKMETNDAKAIAAQSYEASTTFAQGNAKFKIREAGDVKEFEVTVQPADEKHDKPWLKITDNKGNLLSDKYSYPLDKDNPMIEISVPKSHPLYKNGDATVFELSEGALMNDKFTANLVPSEGGNGNLRKMQKIQTDKMMDGKSSTLIDVYHNLNTEVGLKSSTANRLASVARLEHEAAQERVASISGVNLDEEAANMMKFQQAYMASSRVMQAANDTFNTILQLR